MKNLAKKPSFKTVVVPIPLLGNNKEFHEVVRGASGLSDLCPPPDPLVSWQRLTINSFCTHINLGFPVRNRKNCCAQFFLIPPHIPYFCAQKQISRKINAKICAKFKIRDGTENFPLILIFCGYKQWIMGTGNILPKMRFIHSVETHNI